MVVADVRDHAAPVLVDPLAGGAEVAHVLVVVLVQEVALEARPVLDLLAAEHANETVTARDHVLRHRGLELFVI